MSQGQGGVGWGGVGGWCLTDRRATTHTHAMLKIPPKNTIKKEYQNIKGCVWVTSLSDPHISILYTYNSFVLSYFVRPLSKQLLQTACRHVWPSKPTCFSG